MYDKEDHTNKSIQYYKNIWLVCSKCQKQNARRKAGAKYQKGRRERGERGGLRFFCLPWAGFGKPVLSWLIEERKKEKERSRKRRL